MSPADDALVCPKCHSRLTRGASTIDCVECGASYPVRAHGIVDFAPDSHYDRFSDSDVLTEEHLAGLKNEVEGARRRIEDYYLPLIEARRDPTKRILDCGCGNGISVDTLMDRGYDAWGNDLSELRAWQWRERTTSGRLLIADAMRLPFPDGFFDVVISSGVIEHIGVTESSIPQYTVKPRVDRDELRLAFMSELSRVLAVGGDLFLDCPNGAFPIDFWHSSTAGKTRFHSTHEKFLPTMREIRLLAGKAFAGGALEALSPFNRLQFHQASRHLLGRMLAPGGRAWFRMMTWRPFSFLAATALNPFLVVRITKRSR